MFVPFEYQAECLTAIERTRSQGIRKALVVMATGLGKTVLAAFDAKTWLSNRVGKKSRLLYLCHQNDILYQAKATFQAILGHDRSYGYYHGKEKTAHAVDVLFASLQTMEDHKTSFRRDEFAYVMVDESHHSQANSFRQTIEYFTPEFLLGVTATPDRLDKLDIREIFGEEIYSLPLEEAMARGYLAPVEYHMVTDEIQLSRLIETAKGKVSITRLNRSIFIPKRDEEVAKIITSHIAGVENPRVINFCASVKHCNRLADVIPDSFAIHSRIPSKERDVRVEMFRQGIITTVLVVDSFNEGIDIPSANVLSFLRSTDSPTIFLQQLGRGLRKSEGKGKVVVLDFVGNCERIKMVSDLYDRVRQARENVGRGGGTWFEPMTLNVNSAEFQDKIVPILKILDRTRSNFYQNWREASRAVQVLAVASSSHYREIYKNDPRLPGDPVSLYEDFPGWTIFLGKTAKNFYKTWKEASRATRKLKIASAKHYQKQEGGYKGDPRLPFDPTSFYEDFPGWVKFLGKTEKNFYPTWQEASTAAQALGIKTKVEYKKKYAKDKRLPSDPEDFYADCPSWGEFIGTQRSRVKSADIYPTWGEAARAAFAVGVTDKNSYRDLYKKDPRLHSAPAMKYPDFPGWKKFLEKS